MDPKQSLSRRTFVQASAVAGAGMPPSRSAGAAPTKSSAAETTVRELYATLTDTQKQGICFPFDHPKRTRISANWAVTDPAISDKFYTPAQRDLVKKVLKNITSEEGYERFLQQMDDDAGGWDEYHVGIFGDPNTSKFQFMLTGRHITLRADGDSVPSYAFGGPVVYGHGESDPADNIYHYQTKQANKVYGVLDEPHRKKVLCNKAPGENQVKLQGESGKFPGVSVADFSDDQKQLMRETVDIMLAPYREEDRDEVRQLLKQSGGIEKLNIAFYKQGDLKADEVWDIWRVEGPSLVWHFRGMPHAHTYLNIGKKA